MTGAPLATLPLSTPTDVAVAVDAARGGPAVLGRARRWSCASAIFLRYHDLVLDGRPSCSTSSSSSRARRAGRRSRRSPTSRSWRGTTPAARRLPASAAPGRARSRAHPERSSTTTPEGVVGIVCPWNYPLTLAVTDAIPALHGRQRRRAAPRPAGRRSPRCRPSQLLTEAGLPESVLQVVLGDGPTVGQAVVDLADYVCFTGSTATGRRSRPRCAGRASSALPRARRQERDVRRRRRRPRQGRRRARSAPASPPPASCASRSSG